MTPEQAAALRAPFSDAQIGKRPRVWCGACRELTKRERRQSACDRHDVVKCRVCNQRLTDGHMHDDYVGHAEVTSRLIEVDPEWTWEPMALTPDGLPFIDHQHGLWIRLTVCGVTRYGYSTADPGDVKELIGLCLRNAAMRFGVALDMWGAKVRQPTPDGHSEPTASEIRTEIANVGLTRGMDPSVIAAEFEAWSQGVRIGVTEDVKLLAEFLEHLKALPEPEVTT